MPESGRFGDMKMNGPNVYVRTTVQFRPFGPDRLQDRPFWVGCETGRAQRRKLNGCWGKIDRLFSSFRFVHFQPPYCSLWT